MFYSVWNESNLQLFLAPQYDSKGRSVGPALYAKLYAAAYAGIKAGNSKAQVAIGETSSHGRDKALGPVGHALAGPLRPARREGEPAAEVRRLGAPPVSVSGQHEADPAGALAERLAGLAPAIREVARRLVQAQGRPDLDHRVRPRDEAGRAAGVSESQQAVYIKQALSIVKKDQRVQMFVWFVFQDTKTSLWQSGLYRLTGAAKPGRAAFASAAKSLDARNAIVRAKAGTRPTVRVSVREFAALNKPGAKIGITWKLTQGRGVVAVEQPQVALGIDGWVTLQGRLPAEEEDDLHADRRRERRERAHDPPRPLADRRLRPRARNW